MSSTSWAYATVGIALGLTLAPASAREAGPHSIVGSMVRTRPHAVASAENPRFRAELAQRYAPIHYQDVNQRGRHSLNGAADYITAYDFDGDLDSRNNWDNAGNARFPLAAHAYFSVSQTDSHWFVVYVFFHPRDWSASFLETEHENDAEGLLLAIARDGSRHGTLKGAITVSHSDFYSYLPEGSDWAAGTEDVDGPLRLASFEGKPHPVTAQQAEGHGLKAWPRYDIKGDGVVYYPSLHTAEVPEGPSDSHVLYRLKDLMDAGGLWDKRHHVTLFGSDGSFAGDRSGGCGAGVLLCTKNAANAPWGWNDSDDGSPRGAMALDPAALVRSYFRIPGVFALSYSHNPFR